MLSASLNSTQLFFDYKKIEFFNNRCQIVIFSIEAVNFIGSSEVSLKEGMFPTREWSQYSCLWLFNV